MKNIFLLITVFLSGIYSQGILAQTIVKGLVKDGKGRPLAGVSIAIKDSYDGTISDSIGNYSFKTFEKGTQLIQFSAIGYKSMEQTIKIEGEFIISNIQLKEEISELTAVVISAGSFEASDRKRASAVLDPLDIVTTASANGDVTEALKTLPGAQQIGESEGLYVRGGTAAETKTFIDGTLVNNFFFSSVPNIAQFGRFSPFIFKGTVFSTGGYSALYGQALSSALILESIDLPEKTSANFGLSVIGGNIGWQQLVKKKNASWGINYSYTNLAPAFSIIKQKQDYSQAPLFHNIDGNFRIKTSKTGILKYYGYFSSNKLAFTTPSLDSLGYLDQFALKNTNHYHNLFWKETLPKRWKISVGISYSNNKDHISSEMEDVNKSKVLLSGLEFKNFKVNTDGNYLNGKIVLEKKLKGLSAFRFGSEYNYGKDHSTYTDYNLQQFPSSLTQSTTAIFGEGDIYATNDLAIKGGLRLEHSSIIDKTNLAPRFSLAYKLSKGTQASFAYGIFYQTPETKYLPSPVALSFMRADHYILQFQKVINQQSFRVEAFYKKYHDLQKTGIINFRPTAINNSGFGEAKGFEFFWRDKKTFKNFDYWISYSFLDTKRDFLNFPYAITPNFAARHTASVILKKFVTKLKTQFNGAYNFSSGRPYYNIVYDGSQYKFSDKGTIPDYHNFSFSINFLPSIGKKDAKAFAVYVLQISNIFNLRQVYGYQYSYNGFRKQEITPSSRMFIFLCAFISLGVDRSEDVINNSL